MMEDFVIITAFIIAAAGGFAIGMYVTTQISDWIDKNRHR